MRITGIDIAAFGCLSDFSAEIAPGLHIFHGPNESGKSTLQQAVLSLLYGFYESDRAKAGENAARQRYTPWVDKRHTARLEYELQDGRRYRVAREFASADVPTKLWDLVSGRDVTDDFGRGRHGNVQFMRRQLGMTRRVFESCAFVRQGELLQLTGEGRVSPQEMGDAIISLADTARRDVSAQSAITRLAKALGGQVGSSRSRAAPLPVARNRLAAAKHELDEIDRVRADVSADAQTLEGAREQARALEESLTRNRYLLAQTEVTEIQARIYRLHEFDEQSRHFQKQLEANSAFAAFPAEERDEVVQAWNSVRELRQRLVDEQPETERQRQRLDELSERRESLAQRERDLARLRQYPAERQPDIDALAQHWRQAETLHRESQARVAAAAEAAEPLHHEYDQLGKEVGSLTAGDVEILTHRLSASAPSRGAARALLAAIGRVLRAVARAVVTAARALFRRPRTELADADSPAENAQILPSISPDKADRLLHAHLRYLEIAPIVRKFESEQTAAERANAGRDAACAQLRHALEGLADDLSDLDSAYAQFSQRAAGRRQLDTITDQLASLDGDRESLRETVNRFVTDGERLRKLEAQLNQRLSAALGHVGKLEDLIEAFESACLARKLHQEATRSLREIENSRGILLEGRSPSELDEMLSRRASALSQFVADNPSLEGARAGSGRDALMQTVAKESKELQHLELQIEALSTRTATRLDGLRRRAEVEEEIQQRSNEVADLEKFGQALTIARDLIEQAMTEAHRDFAPSVGRFLSEGLAHVTGGRYQHAMLDPATFRVTTEVPETGRLEDVDLLSQGTQAAAYLLLRVGLAQHMSKMADEPVPVLLDDPLVDLDDVRIENFLDLILELSREVQILLFTKDESSRAWFERRCATDASCKITHLEALAPRVPARVRAIRPDSAVAPGQASFLADNGSSSHTDRLTDPAP
jgi:hypothetical protein